ncbi:MAG: hypothetical protein U0930_06000 [Pirellulales bacterium]
MLAEGPRLESLIRRLAECPNEFIETCMTPSGSNQLAAIVADHFRAWDGFAWTVDRLPSLEVFNCSNRDKAKHMRWWGLVSVATWLVHDRYFLERPELGEFCLQWLLSDPLRELAELVRPSQFVEDPDRREELARLCLSAHQLRPIGEHPTQAADRLATLDSVGRQRILHETAEAERRAREVREAMARQRAMESASRYGE